LNETGGVRVVFGDAAKDRDATGKSVIADEGVWPNSRNQFLFGEDVVLPLSEGEENPHDFRLDVTLDIFPDQRVRLRINGPISYPKRRLPFYFHIEGLHKLLKVKALLTIRKPSENNWRPIGTIVSPPA
jgi:hypothetical protein